MQRHAHAGLGMLVSAAARVAVTLALLGAAACSKERPRATETGSADASPPAAQVAQAPAGPAAYVGSERCVPCHAEAAAEWKPSSHATTVRAADLGDEEELAAIISCSGLPVTHVLGDRHQVRWLLRDDKVPWGEGRWLALPCGRDVHEDTITVHHASTWREKPWESSCAACHVTGFRSADHGFEELGVGCEACHGPGGHHVVTAARSDIFSFAAADSVAEVQACAACHLQEGVSRRSGLKFPDNFRPGDDLFADYEFDWTTLDAAVKDGKALDVHQKLVIREAAQGRPGLRCTDCHELHGLGHARHQKLPFQPACTPCHADDLSLKEYSQSCNVCEF